MATEAEINARVEALAATLRQKGLAFSDSQARERAREIVMQEVSMQTSFDKMKDDPTKNPQQREAHVPQDKLKEYGLMTGTELPNDVPLSELLKGRREKKEK